MKRWSFFLHLFISFYIMYPSPIQAIEFRRVDFERLVRNHPLMKRHDPGTGRFGNTPSEIRRIEDIRSDIARTDHQLQETERIKSETVKTSFFRNDRSQNNAEAAWKRIRELDTKIAMLQKDRIALTVLLADGGVPPLQTMVDCVKSLSADVLKSCPAAGNYILLNIFPRFLSMPPAVPDSTLHDFLETHDPETLRKYMQSSCGMNMLFPSTAEPILFQKGDVPR